MLDCFWLIVNFWRLKLFSITISLVLGLKAAVNTRESVEEDGKREKGDYKKQLAEVEKLKIISLFDFRSYNDSPVFFLSFLGYFNGIQGKKLKKKDPITLIDFLMKCSVNIT